MKSKLLCSVLLTVAFLLGACGPSAEQIATMTASAWTPTPKPTATPTVTPSPTPIPYDLTVKVTDADGNPLAGASVVFPESGNGEPFAADDSGLVAWNKLEGPGGSLTVSAPGYFEAGQVVNLERGPNEVVVKLERDPLGLLPSDACAPGEKLLYLEDFQDGKAQGWDNINASVEFAAQNGWSIVPLEEGNQVVAFTGINEGADDLRDHTFDNAVWRLKVYTVGSDGFSFLNWRHTFDSGDVRYPLQWGASVLMALTRLSPDSGHITVGRTQFGFRQNQWYFFEISTYQGVTQVWVDGRQLVNHEDPKLLPPGTIGLEAHIWNDPNTAYYFDNLAVCELSAPFVSNMPAP